MQIQGIENANFKFVVDKRNCEVQWVTKLFQKAGKQHNKLFIISAVADKKDNTKKEEPLLKRSEKLFSIRFNNL